MTLLFKIKAKPGRSGNIKRVCSKLPVDAHVDWDRELRVYTQDIEGNYSIMTCNPEGVDRAGILRLINSSNFVTVDQE